MMDKYYTVLVYAILALLIMLPLLGQGYYLTLDMQFGPNIFSDSKFGNLYGYAPSSYGAYLPFKMIFTALSQLISIEIIQKIFLFLILFLCGFCMHISLPKELGNSRYFGGFLYILNPFVFARFLAGHGTLLLSYAFWPLAIKFFLDFIKNPGDNRILAKVALITMLASISSHGVILLLVAYLAIFIVYSLKSSSFQLLAKQTLVLAIVVLAMNLFWIVPTLLMFEDVYSPASTEAYLADFGSDGGELPVSLAVLTMHGFWREGFTYTKDVFGFWHIPYLIIAALSALGLFVLLKKRKMLALSLLTVFVVAFLLSLGAFNPLLWILTFFEEYIPIHFIFRDSQKFVGLLCLVYSVLGTYGVHYLTQKTESGKRTTLLLALLAVPLLYNFGFFGFLDQIGLTTYPEDWIEAERIMAADNISSSILVLPLHLYNTYSWVNNSQKTLANPAAQFFSKSVTTARNIETEHVYSDVKDPRGHYLKYMFNNRQYINNTAEMLLPLNARYIILLKNDQDSIHYLWLFHRVGGVEDIELLLDGPTLYLFRNNLVKGPFFASKENGSGSYDELMDLTGRGLYSPDVSYEEITPASYRVLDSPYPYVVFTKNYNRFIEFEGSPVFSWHGLANGFGFGDPGIIENRLFYLTLALFLLSWLIALVLISDASAREAVVLAFLFVVVFFLAINGILKPSGLGVLIVLSVFGAVALKCLKRE